MRKRYRIGIYILSFLLVFSGLVCRPLKAYAADATLTFGSNWYDKRDGEEFPVGFYIRSGEGIGTYHIEVKYDNLRLQYISGASEVDEEEGILTFDGTGNSTEVKFWLTFKAISGGEAMLEVTDADVELYSSTTGEKFNITQMGKVPVNIDGEDTAAEQEQKIEGDIQPAFNVEDEDNSSEDEAAEGKEKRFPGNLSPVHFLIIVIVICVIALTVICIWMLRSYRKELHRQKEQEAKRKKYAKQKVRVIKESSDEDLEIISTEVENQIAGIVAEEETRQRRKPVIKVDAVSMRFKISTSNESGLKEYLIQKLKHQVSYREFLALDHISFEVYKGEVVGIIGTNGSGKSTLLKIVAGALDPTDGKVTVDRRKIQILTLGTGFDMELTARENVYLNGSIIGYSREFLDAHYDEIVEFAELQDFMEEKVKNFSSGMVSRLGFAIATAGDAAEILILDEVLSVGDEFFRKKSLKRIKEMIHGGSTVLMVSHGMNTILDNCTKCVWIEKGKLQMVGDPQVVCDAYQKQRKQ